MSISGLIFRFLCANMVIKETPLSIVPEVWLCPVYGHFPFMSVCNACRSLAHNSRNLVINFVPRRVFAGLPA